MPKPKRATFAAGVAAYVYGLAPISVYETTQRFPENQLVSIAALTDPTVRTVVLPNDDTTYTVGRLQLSGGPRVLDVPDTAGRYYVIQLLDAYSNTFAYVGRRTTGTAPAATRSSRPASRARCPPGVKRIQSPTNLVWVLGRTLVQDAADMPAVAALMGGYRFTALDAWTAGQRQNPLLLGAFPTVADRRDPERARLLRQARRDPGERPAAQARRLRGEGVRARGDRPGRAADRPGPGRRSSSRQADRRRAEQRANRFGAKRNNGWLLPGRYIGAYGTQLPRPRDDRHRPPWAPTPGPRPSTRWRSTTSTAGR